VEKIQSAIAKARASRNAPRGLKGATAGVTRMTPPGVQDAWDRLPEIRLVPATLARNRVFTHTAGPEAMPFDMLRTRMLRQMRANNWRRVAITSPDQGCGKSTIAANLALGFARQPDLRAVVLDLDMRLPALARVLGVAQPPQFSETLAGRAAPEDHLRRVGDNLCLALNATPVRGSTELLQSPDVAPLLDRIERALAPDVMIFDMPPMLRGDDTLAFLDKVDCTLLIVEAEVTPIADIDRCEQELAQHGKVMGVVLNKLRHAAGSGYGYGYGGGKEG
jgi:Mrp family chromosome partitioning ATPase